MAEERKLGALMAKVSSGWVVSARRIPETDFFGTPISTAFPPLPADCLLGDDRPDELVPTIRATICAAMLHGILLAAGLVAARLCPVSAESGSGLLGALRHPFAANRPLLQRRNQKKP
jgi:hypothetical protein